MNDLTNNTQIDRLLAPLCGRDAHYFRPATDRNDLAEVLGKLTAEQWETVRIHLYDYWKKITEPARPFILWTHTCDPAIIARAVAEVVRGDETPGDGGAQ